LRVRGAYNIIQEELALLDERLRESDELLINYAEDNATDVLDITMGIYKAAVPDHETVRASNKKESSDLYQKAIFLAKETHLKAIRNEVIECGPINLCVAQVVEQLILKNKFLMALVCGTAEDYLSSHAVNVSILSINIGMGLQLEKDKLRDLGISAFLHDIGMISYMELASQPRKLTDQEYEEIRKHPLMSSVILRRAVDVPEAALEVALQQHERVDGSGYPKGEVGESISLFTKIINIADIYEALTHSRFYRNEYDPFEAMKKILASKASFEYSAMKALVNSLGIFPVGTHVRLSNGEVGQVAEVNQGYPTRPIVHVKYNKDHERLEEIKVLNLLKHPVTYVKECLPAANSEKKESS
jgi:HD-GYP domain-containing protein (c-di-GMP phosphodiesterase class II)